MMTFSSVEAAERYGFRWFEYREDMGLHLVLRRYIRSDGLLVRQLAWARP